MKKQFEKKYKNFIVLDFDDTIFSREKQLEKEKLLIENRWKAGTKIMTEVLWIDYMMKKYYENKIFPNKFIKEINNNDWLILTAWNTELQEAKIKATNLQNIPLIVVETAEHKPQLIVQQQFFHYQWYHLKIKLKMVHLKQKV